MPPKSKDKKNTKDDKKNVTKTDKKPVVRGKSTIVVGAESTKSEISTAAQSSRESVPASQLRKGRMTGKSVDLRAGVSDKTGQGVDSKLKKIRISEGNYLTKVIDEILLESSSSEPEPEEEEGSHEHDEPVDSHKSFMADVDRLLREDFMQGETRDSQERYYEESSDEDMPEYLKQDPLANGHDFLGSIAVMPDVEQLSIDSVDKLKGKDTSKSKPTHGHRGDVGKFVDPITGLLLTSRRIEEEDEEETRIIGIEKPRHETDESLTIGGRIVNEVKVLPPASDDEVSIDIPTDDEEEEEEGKAADVEDTYNQFLELEAAAPEEEIEEIDIEALAITENARILRQETYEFIQYLIDMSVKKAEYVDPSVILRQNLDKRKVMKELRTQLQMLEVERKTKNFLNRKCVEYFRRKRTFRPILPHNPKTLHLEYSKYQEAMTRLDHLLIQEEEAKTTTKINLEAAQSEIIVVNARTEKKLKELEDLMHKTLKRENYDNLQRLVSATVKQMDLLRKEISDMRIKLIEKQHDRATLVQQLEKLEDLGNGLNMRNYEELTTETQTLGKKIEERNAELNKLRLRCHGDIHRSAHQRERQTMLRSNIEYQRQYMDVLEMQKTNLRQFINELKIKRTRLRKAIKNTGFQSGLLERPALMRDYDKTVDYLAVLKERVADSTVAIKALKAKIKILEKHLNNA